MQRGDESIVKKYANRALLLVYPPPGRMAHSCLGLYQGDMLIFVGEGRGGVNGSDAFFDQLQQQWSLLGCETLPCDDDSFQRLYILKQNNPLRKNLSEEVAKKVDLSPAERWRERLRIFLPAGFVKANDEATG